MPKPRPSVTALFQNWSTYEAPMVEKMRLAVRNNLKKARTGSNCCGNHGQPGC